MKHIFTLVTLLFAADTFLFAQSTDTLTFLYAYDEWRFSSGHKQNVDSLFQRLAEREIDSIWIAGHTDQTGTDAYNQQLSQKRVEGVKSYLATQQNVPIHAEAMGESQPLVQGTNIAKLAPNRRVRLIVFHTPDAARVKADSLRLAKIARELLPPVQQYTVYQGHDTVLSSPSGMLMYVKSGTFPDEGEGSATTLYAQEFLTPSQILGARLTTAMADGSPLASEAMFRLWTDNPAPWNKEILTFTPTDTVVEDMQKFVSSMDSAGYVRWLEDEERGEFVYRYITRIPNTIGAPGIERDTVFRAKWWCRFLDKLGYLPQKCMTITLDSTRYFEWLEMVSTPQYDTYRLQNIRRTI